MIEDLRTTFHRKREELHGKFYYDLVFAGGGAKVIVHIGAYRH